MYQVDVYTQGSNQAPVVGCHKVLCGFLKDQSLNLLLNSDKHGAWPPKLFNFSLQKKFIFFLLKEVKQKKVKKAIEQRRLLFSSQIKT